MDKMERLGEHINDHSPHQQHQKQMQNSFASFKVPGGAMYHRYKEVYDDTMANQPNHW